MSEPIRSLADSLRAFDDERLGALLRARPDLAAPVPHGIAPLAARAAAPSSVQRALGGLTLPELCLVEALALLPDPARPEQIARAVGGELAEIAPFLDRLRTLALTWGDDAVLGGEPERLPPVHAVRAISEVLRTPAGLAPPSPEDPSAAEAERLVAAAPEALRPLLEQLAFGPARVEAGPEASAAQALLEAGLARRLDAAHLVLPRSVHLALRGGRVRAAFPARRPEPVGPELVERIPGARTAQALDAAFESLRVLGTVRGWDEDPPTVLRRGGIPQRDLRRLAAQADVPPVTYATVLQSAWCAGLLGHDGGTWQMTSDWDAFRARPLEARWAELVLAWATGHHLAAVVGTPDETGTPRAALSDATRREGVRTRRGSLLRVLAAHPGIRAPEESLVASLGWAFPLVPAAVLQEEVHALLAEGAVLGLVLDGALTELGMALVADLDADVPTADRDLAATLRALAPPPADEVILDADLTAMIPGRPSERLLALMAWTQTVSRGGALTLRFTPASVRRAMGAGADVTDLRALLTSASRTGIPQTLEYLLRDEERRHGQVHVGRALAYLTAEEDVLTLFQSSPAAEALALQRLAPTVAVTGSDPGFALQCVRRAGLSAIAVGPGGSTASAEREHTLHGGPVDADLERVESARTGPELRLPIPEAIARIREADRGTGAEASVTDRLLAAIASGRALRMGIVDGRGGVVARDAIPLSLDGGRLRARDARGEDEFTVLVHRVTLG